MANNSGKSKRRLADMSGAESDNGGTYAPPPPEECDPDDSPYVLDIEEGHRVVLRMLTRGGRVVDFAINQTYRVEPGKWVDVARIDCAHGHVHHHQYTSGGGGEVTSIHMIPADNDEEAWAVIGDEFDKAHDRMFANADAQLATWRAG